MIFCILSCVMIRGVHGSSSPNQPARLARNWPATTWTDQSDGRRRVATHRTRTLRVSWWISSSKTRATRPNHQIKTSSNIQRYFDKKWQIPAIFLLFRRSSTWNPLDPARSSNISSRSSLDSMDPAKYRPNLAESYEILAPAMKPETNRHKPENRWTRTGQPNH